MRRVGSIVLTPGAGRRFVIQVTTPAPDGRAIVARRSLGYLPHTMLRLPILMSQTCAGVVCDPALTCVQGGCVPADVDPMRCEGAGCDEGTLGDGGKIVDAGIDTGMPDAPIDAGPLMLCSNVEAGTPGSCPGSLEPLPLFSQWRFDELPNLTKIADEIDFRLRMLFPGYTHTTDSSLKCGSQLSVGNAAQPLAVNADAVFGKIPLTISFFLRALPKAGTLLSMYDGKSGWFLSIAQQAQTWSLTFSVCVNQQCGNAIAVADVTTTWHRVVANIDGSGKGFLHVDSMSANTLIASYAPANPGTFLTFGSPNSTFAGDIDELYFYCK